MAQTKSGGKPPCPDCETSLQLYYELRERLNAYFFEGKQLNISNSEIIKSYTYVYNLLEKDAMTKMRNQKKYESYEETYGKVFKNDLIDFCKRIQSILVQSRGLSSPVDELSVYYHWIVAYTRFLHWTYKTFMLIEKNSKSFVKTTLFHQGLLIMRDYLIVPYYDNLFGLLCSNLQLFKENKLEESSELQFIILAIGMCGFSKYRSIKLEKNENDIFHFKSINKETNQKAEIEYENEFFLKNFTTRMIRHLQTEYRIKSAEMMQFSSSEYVNKALQYLENEQEAAEYFYPNANVKSLIISSIQEILITNNCEQLITNQKTGLNKMIDSEDIESLKNLYRLLKRTSQHKIFAKYYQAYIQKKITTEILTKITPEEEKLAKKETVYLIIELIYNFYNLMDRITVEVHSQIKDPHDLSLFSAQSSGFQVGCNKTNTVCNYLAYYCDYALKKQPNPADVSLQDLQQRLFKITKLLYSMDNFLKLYQRLLGVRILYDTFKNRDTEIEIINNLKNEVGVSPLTKINSMISDYKFSETFAVDHISKFKGKLSFNFQVIILTAGSWQVQDLKNSTKLVPPELQAAVQMYENEYKQLFKGRQITWVFNYGRGIVQVKYESNPKALLFLNNYQLLVVLYLQRRQFFSCKISTLISEIGPEEEPSFMASMHSLVKRGILICKTGNPGKIESKEDVIEFNWGFKPKSIKTGCFEIPRFTEKVESVSKELTSERGIIIQANIIKLMKTKKMLHYHHILQEVPKMCKTFKAEMSAVKNQIQNCIHKDFLERDEKDINILIYKP